MKKQEQIFNSSRLHTNVHMASFRIKLMMLYNFVNLFFPQFHSVFEREMLILQSSIRSYCRWFYSEAHDYFPLPRHTIFMNIVAAVSKLRR